MVLVVCDIHYHGMSGVNVTDTGIGDLVHMD
jgi:hypothetical protein